MDERNDREQRRPAEGVRIIGADEAQAAIDAGAAAGRRPDDELRFGDVPPAPSGPRPPHRFPLPDSVDPAEAVPRPQVVAPVRGEERPGALRAIRPILGDEAADEPEDSDERWAAFGAGDTPSVPGGAGDTPSQPGGAGDTPSVPGGAGDPPSVPGDSPDVPGGAGDTYAPGPPPAGATPTPVAGETYAAGGPPSYEAAPSGYSAPDMPIDESPAAYPGGTYPEGADPAADMDTGSYPAADAGPENYPAADSAGGTYLPRQDWFSSPAPSPARDAPAEPTPPAAPWVDDPLAGRAERPWVPPPPPVRDAGAGTGAGLGRDPVWGEPRHLSWDEPSYSPYVHDDRSADLLPGGLDAGEATAATEAAPDIAPPDPAPPDPPVPPETAGERITLSGLSGSHLPHWTDPPTGEVPRILAGEAPASDEDLGAWQAVGSRGLRWRDEAGDWDDVEELEALGSDDTRVGALDTNRSEHSDLFSFDEAFERLEEERSSAPPTVAVVDEASTEPAHSRSRSRRHRPPPPPAARRRGGDNRPGRGDNRPGRGDNRPGRGDGRPPPPARRGPASLANRVAVGAALVAVLLIFYFIGPIALLVLSAVIIGGAAAEGYGMLQRAGFRPATLLGLVASVAIVFAGYWKGAPALPLIATITFTVSMLWYMLGIVEARPLANVAVTNLMFVWVGLLGSYAALMLRAHSGRGLFLGAVVTAVGADIVAYFGGRRVGSRPMAPAVSPGKTWEGATLGFLAAVVIGAVVGHTLTPWGGVKHGLLLGVVIGVAGPIGDLAESMIKRDLGIKDSGTALGGHGGLLDRFDSLLLVLPAAYYLASYTNILK